MRTSISINKRTKRTNRSKSKRDVISPKSILKHKIAQRAKLKADNSKLVLGYTDTKNADNSVLNELKNNSLSGYIKLDNPSKNIVASFLYYVNVTPDLARKILLVGGSYNGILRDSREITVNQYAEDMADGLWNSNDNISFGWDIQSQRWVVLNGKTRLNAVILSGKSIVFPIIEQHTLDTNTMCDQYATIDNGRSRKVADASKCYGVFNKLGQLKFSINSCIRSARFIRGAFDPASRLLAHVRKDSAVCLQYLREIETYYTICNSSRLRKDFNTRANIVAPCLVMLKSNPRKGKEFVKGVITGEGFYEKDPRQTVNLLFTNTAMYKSKTMNQTINCVFSAWNAWLNGEQFKAKPPKSKPSIYSRPDNIQLIDLYKLQKNAQDFYENHFKYLNYSEMLALDPDNL